MANNRELSQLASLIVVDDTTRNIGIATTGFSNVGIGTTSSTAKLSVFATGNTFSDVNISNSNNGASVYTQLALSNDSSTLVLQNNASSRTVSRLGGTIGGWGELYLTSGNGIRVGTSNESPLVLGTNNTEALRIDSSQRVGIGTTNPTSKLYVYDDNQNSNTYSSQVYRTSTNFSSGVGHRAYYESYYTTAGVQTSYASGINAQVSASVAAGSTNNGYVRAALDNAWRNGNNAQSSTDNGTLNILYGRGIQYGHFNDSVVSPITNTVTGLYLTPYCLTGSIGTLIGIDINSVATSVGATATNVYGINCEIDTTDGTNSYNLYISGNANNYIAGSVGLGTTNPTAKLNVVDNSSSDALRITQTGSGNAFVVEDSANPDATPFVVRADGKVGVGTTGLIQYGPNVGDTSTFGIIASTGNDSAFVLKGNNGSTTDGSGQTLAILVGTTGGTGSGTNLIHYSHDTSGIGTRRNAIRFTDNQIRFEDNVSGSVDVTINSSGDGELLVGTTTTTGTSSQALQVNSGAYFNGSVGIGTTNPTSTLQVGAASTQAFYVFSDGRVGIGQTNPAGVFAARDNSGTSGFSQIIRAEKKGTSDTSVFRVDISADSNEVQLIGTGNQASNISIVNGGNTTAYFKAGGNVGIGTTNPTSKLHVIGDVLVTGITTSTDFNSSSDINLKDNIERIQNPIDKLQQLDGVTFNWKETHRASVGVIAQQVEKVLPQLVSGDETKTVNYNGLIALLIECVKEQQIEINNLKEKLK